MDKNARQISRRHNTVLVSTFLGNVVQVTSHHQEQNCLLTAQTFQLDQQRKKFTAVGQTASFQIQAQTLYCVAYGSVENDFTGLVNLYMIVGAESGKQWTYFVLQVTTSAIKFISQFYLPYRISRYRVNITAGLRVVWLYKGQVIVYNAAEKTQKILARDYTVSDLLWSGIIGSELVTLIKVKYLQGTDAMDSSSQYLMSFSNQNHFKGISLRSETQDIPMTKLIPDVYTEITTALNVNNDETIVISTSESQLISFKDGEIQSICQLPFKDSMAIEFAVVTGGKELIAVRSTSSEVCCVWSHTFKVAETSWQGISKVLVDDLCMCGSDQLLLLSMDAKDSVNIFTGFKLTDLQRYNITDEQEMVIENAVMDSQNNLKSAVKALETRKQVSVAAVKEKRLNLADKVRMIHQSHKALVNMAAGEDENEDDADQTASLICLYDGSLESTTPKRDTKNVQTHDQNVRHPSISSPWQRLVDDQWVVGVKVQNTTRQSLLKIALTMIASDDEQYPIILQSKSSACSIPQHHNHRELFEEPLLKRMKSQADRPKLPKATLLPGDSIYVCAVTNLPVFNRPCLKCNLVLHWNAVDDSQPRVSICVGDVTLLATDVARGDMQINCQEFSGSLTDQDEITLNAVQQQTVLDITSHYSNINQLPALIQNSLKFQPITNNSGFICMSGAFRLCRIYVTILNAKKLKAQIFTRDKKSLHLFIHSLNEISPDDVTITLNQSAECFNSTSQNALEKLEEELTTKLEILTDQISSQANQTDSKKSFDFRKFGDHDEEGKSIDDWRREFAAEKELTKRKSSEIKIEGQRAKTIETDDLSKKVTTDKAFMELARISRI